MRDKPFNNSELVTIYTYSRGALHSVAQTTMSLGNTITLEWDEQATNERTLRQIGKELNHKCCPADLRMDIDCAINACDITFGSF